MATSLRIDPGQRFSCAQCGRCCRRWEIVVTRAEADALNSRGAARWFRESPDGPEGTTRDPFEPIDRLPGFAHLRKRADGACGFLSPANRCRIHEELGAARKPLTCRVFPFSFHLTPSAAIVATSFGCPTVAANEGALLSAAPAVAEIAALREEWFATYRPAAQAATLVRGRPIDARSIHVLRTNLLHILNRVDTGGRDLRTNARRMAVLLEDLTRARVLRLADQDFAEYVSLTAPYAATVDNAVAPRAPSRIGRLLQRGFLFAAAAMRLRMENRGASAWRLRWLNTRLLAHFHGVGPGVGRINLARLRGAGLDVNAPSLQTVIHHYLRASIESMDAGDRPLIDTLVISASILNSACALAVMNAAGQAIDAAAFTQALVEANDLAHAAPHSVLGELVARLAGGVEALYTLGNAGS